ncbi:hypothetical protein [Arthrobacter sp. AQ5-05]|uniref:hypothetical protein n=1 Tax=Arthrobacter sp. AQ5-05 TaxID=2184581 RepID=UPI0011BFA1FF|nr:hypothetical protein [Arthrobacter sp. AQ5-05]
MPVTREARYLSGVDLGKQVHIADQNTGGTWHEGILVSVKHYDESVDLLIRESETGPLDAVLLSPTDAVTITGKAS